MEGENAEPIRVLKITESIVHRQLAKFVIGCYGDSLHSLVDSIKFLSKDPGLAPHVGTILKEKFGDALPQKLESLKRAAKYSKIVKSYYDDIQAAKIRDLDISSLRFQKFKQSFVALDFVDSDVFEIFFALVSKTTLANTTISSKALADERKIYKSFEFPDEKAAKLKEEAVAKKEEVEDDSEEDDA